MRLNRRSSDAGSFLRSCISDPAEAGRIGGFMRVGVLVAMSWQLEEKFRELRKMGMQSCQLVSWEEHLFTDEMAEYVLEMQKKYEVDITAFWCGWSGPVIWNFYDGPETLGLVPAAYRDSRLKTLMHGSDFAKKIGVSCLVTHVGFLPENPNEKNYREVVYALRWLAEKCKANGQYFLFETGQETPVTLLRTIQDIGYDNVGINFDPANLILYGKANPVDALDTFGKYVMGIHGKDGLYPTDGHELGEEVALGEGKVNYPALIEALKKLGYNGDITIEREIVGEQQAKDILKAKKLLEALL